MQRSREFSGLETGLWRIRQGVLYKIAEDDSSTALQTDRDSYSSLNQPEPALFQGDKLKGMETAR